MVYLFCYNIYLIFFLKNVVMFTFMIKMQGGHICFWSIGSQKLRTRSHF